MPAGAPPPLLVTMGDPAGIGPEIAVQTWRRRRELRLPPFAYVGDADDLAARSAALGADVPLARCAAGEAAELFPAALPVIEVPLAAASRPGHGNPANAAAIVAAIETAVGLVHAGHGRAVVTNPISKAVLQGAGFSHPGHTEFLGELAERLWGARAQPVMMLACPELRVVPVTVHVALAAVPRLLSEELIVETGRIVARDLAGRFAVAAPRLAVCGLNPHAGEEGRMGDEEIRIVAPAVARLRAEGIDARGPFPADALFRPQARAGYDAVLAMYHDQALIPIKTIAFERAVNVTLGLPFVRTSPDHGTAFDIAGTGTADATSLSEAIRLADRLAPGA